MSVGERSPSAESAAGPQPLAKPAPVERHAPNTEDEAAALPAGDASEAEEAEERDLSRAVADPEQRLLNRDLSWLEFNRRVLAQAVDERTPLLTRVRFLSIFSSNLDEFFMKRVGFIKRLIDKGVTTATPDGLSPRQLLFAIRSVVCELMAEQARAYERDILPALAGHGITISHYEDLTARQRKVVDQWFSANVFPVLTPLAVDPGHRFPFISNLSENIGAMVSQPGEEDRHFARVKIPDVLPRLIPVREDLLSGPEHTKLPPSASAAEPLAVITLDEVIRNNLDDLFPGMRIHEVMAFRVTRNAAVEIEEDDHEDLLTSVENELRLRRFARAVRLEAPPDPPKRVLDFVVNALRLEPEDVYERGGPLEYGDLLAIAELQIPQLKEPRWIALPPPRLAPDLIQTDADIFAAIRERDILLHHPYESFNASVERFIAAAARDPDVLCIKQTIYRTSPDSPFIASLVRAAEEGKQVAVLVELRARFDESKNVRFARMLEKAGVHVAYGVVGLKTHCKISLVVRREAGGLRSYAHVGTGNYNPSTAQLYTDFGLLTCDPEVTEDVIGLFNFLTGRSLKKEYGCLLVAPFEMRRRFMSLIDAEISHARRKRRTGKGPGGRIIAKMNALEDLKITSKLYEASRAGVKITLIVRGFCCLRPGAPGLSENIRVVSVIGRFLEHSRIFHFGAGHEEMLDGEWYISSADWMYRNLSARVEAAAPVKDRAARARLKRIIEIMLEDHRCAWDLRADGTYSRRSPGDGAAPDSPHALGTFEALMREVGGRQAMDA
jgi:polyphosphate kinase